MHYLKTYVTGSAKAAIAGLSFSSQAYHQAWEVLTNKFGRPSVIVGTYMRKIYSHPPVRHDDSSSIVKFADTVTNTVNVLKQLGYTADLESETSLSAATRKLSIQLHEQWLKNLQDLR